MFCSVLVDSCKRVTYIYLTIVCVWVPKLLISLLLIESKNKTKIKFEPSDKIKIIMRSAEMCVREIANVLRSKTVCTLGPVRKKNNF